jgi:hypothetical protein
METIIRNDLLTGEDFVPKKISQRFATPQNRIKYNNNKANALRQERAFVDKPINSTHRVLRELMKNSKKQEFYKQFLLGKGVDFRVSNNTVKVDGFLRYALYEFIYIFDDNDTNGKVTIINNSDGRY